MISSNEIKEGNWYRHSPTWSYRNPNNISYCFKWTDSDWYALGECTIDLQDIEPIELDFHWFVKFRFHTDGITWWKGDFVVGEFKDGYWFCPDGKISDRAPRVKYVHELQVLYHCWMGQEIDRADKTVSNESSQ